MRAIAWTDNGHHFHAVRFGHRRHRHGPFFLFSALPLALVPPALVLTGVAAIVALSVLFGVLVTVLAMVIGAAVSIAAIGGVAYGGWLLVRYAVPALGSGKRRDRISRVLSEGGKSKKKRQALVAEDSPVEILRRRYAAGEIGQTEFRTRLVELLKERYVRGDLTLSEYEARVSSVLLDPALRTPGA